LAKILGNNPKDNLGIKKVSISKLPAAGIIHGSHAMMYGAAKYGPYNWRDNAVVASIYYDAIMRHLMAWYDQKEEVASDSHVHHLGHILANCAILLDALETGNLLDDRPHSGRAALVMERLNNALKKSEQESVPDSTGNSHEVNHELVRQAFNAGGVAAAVENAPVGPGQQSGHSALPSGAREMVCQEGSTKIHGTNWSR
jgi:hypothetical protein